jgi:hypothetical protein
LHHEAHYSSLIALFFFKKVAQDMFEECEKVSYNQMETIPRGEDHFHKEQITLCAQVKVM